MPVTSWASLLRLTASDVFSQVAGGRRVWATRAQNYRITAIIGRRTVALFVCESITVKGASASAMLLRIVRHCWGLVLLSRQ